VGLATVAWAADDAPLTDAGFVTKAASGGLFEVESSKLAADRAESADVKAFAKRMIADHTNANAELKAAAQRAGLTVPAEMTDADRMLMDKVSAAKGAGFDRAYADAQKAAHDDAVALFEKAAAGVRDPGLKAFAEKTLPTLKEHKAHVQKLTRDGPAK
jgi:putative membrane protein